MKRVLKLFKWPLIIAHVILIRFFLGIPLYLAGEIAKTELFMNLFTYAFAIGAIGLYYKYYPFQKDVEVDDFCAKVWEHKQRIGASRSLRQ